MYTMIPTIIAPMIAKTMPVWLIILSDQLPITALVGHYPTNKLIGRRPILKCEPKPALTTYPEGFVEIGRASCRERV